MAVRRSPYVLPPSQKQPHRPGGAAEGRGVAVGVVGQAGADGAGGDDQQPEHGRRS